MSGYIGDLSAKQERALLQVMYSIVRDEEYRYAHSVFHEQLRENLSNVVLSDHDDHCLLRWLRGTYTNIYDCQE